MTDKQIRPPYEIALMHDHILRLEEEINQLKTENIKFTLDSKKLVAQYSAKLERLKQTLAEIKEIAQYDVYTSSTDLCLKLNWIKKKISEVENVSSNSQ